jgi:hypothetical protein
MIPLAFKKLHLHAHILDRCNQRNFFLRCQKYVIINHFELIFKERLCEIDSVKIIVSRNLSYLFLSSRCHHFWFPSRWKVMNWFTTCKKYNIKKNIELLHYDDIFQTLKNYFSYRKLFYNVTTIHRKSRFGWNIIIS